MLDQIPVSRHIVCFWKQNDLGVYGRRADRWIRYWTQHPGVERIWVVEPAVGRIQLLRMLEKSVSQDRVESSEFILLLNQLLRKGGGQCDTGKIRFVTELHWEQAHAAVDVNRLSERLRSQGMNAPMVVLWPLCSIAIEQIDCLNPSFVLTDIVDDQRQFKSNQARLSLIQEQYRQLMAKSDLVISNSLPLVRNLEDEFMRYVQHVPNEWLPPALASDSVSAVQITACDEYMRSIKTGRVAGYVGNLRERIDVDRLVNLISNRQDWSFWFVGQAYKSEFYARAKHYSNCRFFGSMPRDLAMTAMSHFDIALVPFVDDPLTRSMSLLKLEEYNSKGLEVLDFRQMSDARIDHLLDVSVHAIGKPGRIGGGS